MPDIRGTAVTLAKLLFDIGVAGKVGLVIIRAVYTALVAPVCDKMRAPAYLLVGLALAASVLGFMLRGAVLTLAAANNLRVAPAMQAGDDRAARHLARSIEIETAVILVMLAAIAAHISVLTLSN